MAYTYDQFRQVLRKAGFQLIRSGKHEVWAKVEPEGTVYKAPISHLHGRDIPNWLFAKMLRQAGLSKDEFERWLKDP